MREAWSATTGDPYGAHPMSAWNAAGPGLAVVAASGAPVSAAEGGSLVALGRSIRSNLAAWRRLDRELLELPPGSPAWTDVQARMAGYRSNYLELFDRYVVLDSPRPVAPEPSWFSRARGMAPTLLPGPLLLELLVATRR